MRGSEWVYLCIRGGCLQMVLYVHLNIRMTQRWETMCVGLIEKERDRCSLWIVCVILREAVGLCCWMMRLDWSLLLDSYRRNLTSWLLFSRLHTHTQAVQVVKRRNAESWMCVWMLLITKGCHGIHTPSNTHSHTLFLYERHCETLQAALVHGGMRACY